VTRDTLPTAEGTLSIKALEPTSNRLVPTSLRLLDAARRERSRVRTKMHSASMALVALTLVCEAFAY